MSAISSERFIELLSELEAETGSSPASIVTELLCLSTLLLAAALPDDCDQDIAFQMLTSMLSQRWQYGLQMGKHPQAIRHD